jgi:hypothetical protein
MRERTDDTLKNRSQKGLRAAIATRVPAEYPHDVDTGPYPEVTQVAAEREKHTVLVLRTIRATSTRFLVGCHGGHSSCQCPACGGSCQLVSTYNSITPTHTLGFTLFIGHEGP